MEIFGETIERELPDLARAGRAHALHRPTRPRARPSCRSRWPALEEETADNERLNLWIAFDYGGRAELVEAARRLVEAGVDPARDRREHARANLYAPELPDPDLLIRTSGELRISNFLLWQLAYAELVFIDTLWPDFGGRELDARAGRVRAAAPPLRRRDEPRSGPRIVVGGRRPAGRPLRSSGSAAGGCSR